MASLAFDRKNRRYLIRWRDGGRGSAEHVKRISDKAAATDFFNALERRQLSAKPAVNRLTMGWPEIVDRWHQTRPEGDYRDRAKKYLDSLGWERLEEAMPELLASLRPHYFRLVKSVLNYAHRTLLLHVDQNAINVRPLKVAKRPKRPLLPPDDIQALVDKCAASCPGNGALAHLLATYGHRAENLVRLTASALQIDANGTGWLTLKVKSGDIIRHPLAPASLPQLQPLAAAATAASPKKWPQSIDHNGATAPLLFINHLGVPWKDGQAFAAWFHHSVSCGIGYYDAFKRAAITSMLDTVDATTVASITGHRTVSLLVNTYSRTNADRQLAALAAIKPVVASPVCAACVQEKS